MVMSRELKLLSELKSERYGYAKVQSVECGYDPSIEISEVVVQFDPNDSSHLPKYFVSLGCD